jgi:transcription antitermination factor NusG
MTWTILLSAPSMEFKIRDTLTLSGVSAYVPVEFKLGKGKPASIRRKPIAPGYVFADVDDWAILHSVDGLRSRPLLMVDGKISTISPGELASIIELSRPSSELKRPGQRLTPGQRIQIKRGNLIAINAIIDRITKGGKAVAVVDMLGKQHEIVVTEDMVA